MAVITTRGGDDAKVNARQDEELTAQEAADMINVSRPHLVKLLEEHPLLFHKAGKHRRVRFADLVRFKVQRDQTRSAKM